jgi:hypothetical protein
VQRQHVLASDALVQRMLPGSCGQWRHQLVPEADSELDVDQIVLGSPAFLQPAAMLAFHPLLAQPGQRLPVPQRQRISQ